MKVEINKDIIKQSIQMKRIMCFFKEKYPNVTFIVQFNGNGWNLFYSDVWLLYQKKFKIFIKAMKSRYPDLNFDCFQIYKITIKILEKQILESNEFLIFS